MRVVHVYSNHYSAGVYAHTGTMTFLHSARGTRHTGACYGACPTYIAAGPGTARALHLGMTTKAKRTTFDVATANGGRAQRTGYVLGAFGAHKDAGKGVYFWTFTHLATGMSVNMYPVLPETKAQAIAHLETLEREGLPDHVTAILSKYGTSWGLGM